MKTIDHYHKWVEWSEEDRAHIGKCPAGDDTQCIIQIAFAGSICKCDRLGFGCVVPKSERFF